MKKQFFAMVLALALCVGLAVPAFADAPAVPFASQGDDSMFRVFVTGTDKPVQKTMSLLLGTVSSGKDGLSRTRMADEGPRECNVTELDLGTGIRIEGLQDENGEYATSYVLAWSDPDGDGYYDRHIFRWDHVSDINNLMRCTATPLTDPGPFKSDEPSNPGFWLASEDGVTYYHSASVYTEPRGQTVSEFSADYLTELFGPNTLVQISLYEPSFPESGGGAAYQFYLTGKPASSPAPEFTDLEAGAYYTDAVAWAVEGQITNGTSDTAFSPDDECTQVQILTFLWRAADKPTSSAALPVDITGKNVDYAAAALRWAAEKGMIDSTFDVGAKCTRAAAVTYIWQARGSLDAEAAGFTDVPADADCAAAVAWAVENGVTNGTSETEFSPGDVCTRGQIVTFLHRAYVPEARLK